LKESVCDFGCSGRILTVDFHPTAAEVLSASHSGFDGSFLSLYDVSAQKQALSFDLPKEGIYDVSFSYNGSVLSSTCKDKKTRIIDPRAGKTVQEFEPFEGQRDTRVIWLGNTGRLLTIGFGRASSRSVSIWDPSNLRRSLKQIEIDQTNASLLPHYDEDTGLLYLGSNGGRIVRVFHVHDESIDFLTNFMSNADVTGLAFRPKAACDVKAAEVGQMLTIYGGDKIMPVTFRVPRKRLEYFQDDLYPSTRVLEPSLSAAEWFAGKSAEPRCYSLRPDNMELLSQAPPEALTEKQLKYQAHLAAKAAPKPVGPLGLQSSEEVRDHFRAIASANINATNRWDARPDDSNDVADDEWN